MSEILLEIDKLRKYFPVKRSGGTSYIHAVEDVSLFIRKGETLGLVGESGCGKSTLGRAILRLHEPTSGRIIYDGKPFYDSEAGIAEKTKPYRRKMQIIFQDPSASLNPRMTAENIIGEALDIHKMTHSRKERHERVVELLRRVGLNEEQGDRYPHEFSGGQRQRIGLARAMIMEPELVVADEPISALDVSIRAQVLNLLKKFQREQGTTYLFIAHDLSIVRFISDRIGVIYKGDIVEVAEAEELFNFPMHPYTRSLISAIPIPDPILEKNKVLFTYDPSVHDYSEDKPELVEALKKMSEDGLYPVDRLF